MTKLVITDFEKLHTGLAGGRFAKPSQAEPLTVAIYPRPPSGPWAAPCPSGDEPPLGYDVNEPIDVNAPYSPPAPPSPSEALPTDEAGAAEPQALGAISSATDGGESSHMDSPPSFLGSKE